MKQIVYEIVIFLHLMGYTNKNRKIKMLTEMYNHHLEIEPEALVNIVNSLIEELKDKKVNNSIIVNLEEYVNIINRESSY